MGDLASLQGLIPKEMIHFLSQVGFQGGKVLTTLLEEELRRMTSKKYERNLSWRKGVLITSLKSLFLEEGGFCRLFQIMIIVQVSSFIMIRTFPFHRELLRIIALGLANGPYSYLLIQILNNRVWVGKAVIFVRVKCNFARKGSPEKGFAFVRYMQTIPPENVIQKELRCIVLRWATDEDYDGIAFPNSMFPADSSDEKDIDEPSAWFGIIYISAVLETVQVVQDSVHCRLFFNKEHWKNHRFYIKRFLKVPLPEMC